MQKQLEIMHAMQNIASTHNGKMSLRRKFRILNLPGTFHCEEQCRKCINREGSAANAHFRELNGKLPMKATKQLISLFARRFGTKFVAISGRGDPFHPRVAQETMQKIAHATSEGVRSYVFTQGNNLSPQICRFLSNHGVNVMIGLAGNNTFIDEKFFKGAAYGGRSAEIATSLRTLFLAYTYCSNPPAYGLTRLGMNYVLGINGEPDLDKLAALKDAANGNGIYFVCNTPLHSEEGRKHKRKMAALALAYSDFNLPHSTYADGRCQMGAGSSITIAPNEDVYRCPHMMEGSMGNIMLLKEEPLTALFSRCLGDRRHACVIRKTTARKV
ncbi:hypothetical protein JW721_00360 [Candidatus Micrarchaeota archaeon]|nr:hypothetical protein [Candidatus Micrarchaeota archaeon]